MDVIFLVLGMIVFAISTIFAYKKRHNTSKLIASLTLGILFATFIMILPTEWIKEGKVVESPILYTILSSLLYSFKAIGGRQDIAQLETIALSGILKTVYIYFNYIMFTLSPILASSLILSFFGDTGERIRYFLSFSPKCYVFSEINPNSIALAKGLKKENDKKTLVFCDSKKAEEELLSDAKELGAITLNKTCSELTFIKNYKKYEFCFLSDDEDSNLELTENIIFRSDRFKKYKITVNTFAKSGPNVAVLESLLEPTSCIAFESPDEQFVEEAKKIIAENKKAKIVFFNTKKADKEFLTFADEHDFVLFKNTWRHAKVKDKLLHNNNVTLHRIVKDERDTLHLKVANKRFVDTWEDTPLRVRFIDEIALFCNNLLFEKPLFNLPNNSRDISVLLIGCGRLGMSMLKTVVWCGQIEGYSLKIRVVDKDKDKVQKELYAQAPELKGNYNIEFFEADIESEDFEPTIQKFTDTTFVCVATGSDDLNIFAAESTYRIFRRNYSGDIPPIYTRVRKDIKSNTLNETSSYLEKRNIEVFGTTDSIFSNKRLFHSKLENLALCVHLCYCKVLNKPRDSFSYKKALNEFYTSEYSRRSSMAVALHIPAKLHAYGIKTNTSDNLEPLVSESDLNNYEKNISIESLAKNEHDRWNAFLRSEGFRTASIETFKKMAPLTLSSKDVLAKLHPCIVTWENLDELQEEYDNLGKILNLKEDNFKNNDRDIIAKIPEIIKKANELCKEDH